MSSADMARNHLRFSALCVSGTRSMGLLLALLVLTAVLNCCTVLAVPAPRPPPATRPVRSPPFPPPPRPPPPPPAPPAVLTLKGKITYKNAHTRSIWTLATSNSIVYKLPQQPVDASEQPIPALTTISLNCTLAADDPTSCTRITEARVTLLAAPVPTTGQTLRLLVMVVSLTASSACGARSGASLSAVQNAYTSTNGYIDFLGSCSYGRMVYDRSRLTVVGTPVVCSAAINRCGEDAIAAAAKTAASETVRLSSFTHFSYILPTGLVNTCGWVGLAELPGTQTWYTPDNNGFFDKGTLLQETLHNFGIFHGWKDGAEYADYSTSMGYGASCPSGPELWRLGWAGVMDQLNSSSFPARVFQRYSLPATYVGPNRAVIKIQPDWLGASYRKNVYLALRMRAAGDRDLRDEFNQKISIHELDKNIDNNFRASGDPRVSIIGTIPPWSTKDLPAYKLYVRTEALVGSTLGVKVCRYISGPSECVDGANPSPSPPPPSPPPKRSPPPPRSPRSPPPTMRSPPPSPPPSPQRHSPPPPPPLRSPPPPRKVKSPPPPPPDDYYYYAPPPYSAPPPY